MNDTMYQVMPPLTADEYAELKSDIEQRGVMVPVEYDEDGNILDGHHRVQICEELGIADFPKIVRTGFTESEKRTHARKLNMARRHLSGEQKRELTKDEMRNNPYRSDRQVANDLGVSNGFVSRVRKEMERDGELCTVHSSIGADGKERPRQVERKPIPIYEDSHTDYQLDELLQAMGEDDELEEPKRELPQEPEQHKPHVSYNSGNNEWYTPADIIEAARKTMGGIDLDPATSEVAQDVVKATTYYTAEANGLDKPWSGRVWMNPPYASELIGQFVDKLVSELPNIEQAIVLVNNATETEWFNKLVDKAAMVCFPKSRVKFYMPDGKTGAPLQGQAILYFGDNASAFSNEFRNKGWLASIV